MTKRAVIFDLDGTLVHSSPDIAYHLNYALDQVFGTAGTLSDHDVEMLIGGGMLDLIGKGIDALGVTPNEEEAEAVLKIYRQAYLDEPVVKTALYDGVLVMLDEIESRGMVLGLCTNKSEATAYRVLDHFNLTARFAAIIGGDTTPARKPEPAPLQEACLRIGVAAEKALMVGDSKADFGAARKAGVKIALVDWGYSSVDIHSLGGDIVLSGYDGFAAKAEALIA